MGLRLPLRRAPVCIRTGSRAQPLAHCLACGIEGRGKAARILEVTEA